MKKIYAIAQTADMDPDQFCKVQNQCFEDAPVETTRTTTNDGISFRGLIASTRISELLGVEPVAARDTIDSLLPTLVAKPEVTTTSTHKRAWWYDVGDYLENPHRHFAAMSSLRVPVEWPKDVSE